MAGSPAERAAREPVVTPARAAAARSDYQAGYRAGMLYAASLYESVRPSSDEEREHGVAGAGAMGAVIEFRDLIRREAANLPQEEKS